QRIGGEADAETDSTLQAMSGQTPQLLDHLRWVALSPASPEECVGLWRIQVEAVPEGRQERDVVASGLPAPGIPVVALDDAQLHHAAPRHAVAYRPRRLRRIQFVFH